MNSKSLTIDHNTLTRLIEAGAVRGAHVISQIGGWGLIIKYGTVESSLATTRSKEIRKFKKLETLVTYLNSIGINRFDVDATGYDQSSIQTYKRPDRTQAMRDAQAAVEHDKWFRATVTQALIEADDPNTQWVSNDDVAANWELKRAEFQKRLDAPQS